jgi:hypothetical protein
LHYNLITAVSGNSIFHGWFPLSFILADPTLGILFERLIGLAGNIVRFPAFRGFFGFCLLARLLLFAQKPPGLKPFTTGA